ncbi:hypothetical protein [Dyadobacter arcticus]|uniref:Lipoprotein n=1 Tax=Dyadobacter arcticus TaxID=1078754 RepID=A0ABX0USN9_9BACT|nr:hypothetical protein [Dyadobacter arcticus]NIJ55229.1 hypothetical protein [Dyadobacter arcticus]
MNNFSYTSRLGCFLLALALLTACKHKRDVDPVENVPIGKAFVTIESEEKKETYIEGNSGIESLNLANFSTENANPGHGGGISINGKDRWEFYFYYSEDEYYANTGNFTKLFHSGPFEFIKLNRDFKFLNIRGVEIIKRYTNADGSGGYKSTVYQEDLSPQKFEVTNAYFYNETYDRFIWVEGTFECGIGYFDDIKPVKGRFRIKVQHNLE